MAHDKPVNVQDVFLNHVRKNKIPVTVFLLNGVKLQGLVTWFDTVTMLLRRDGHSQLVYKHAISTLMPQGPLILFDGQHHTNHNYDSSNNTDQDEHINDEDTNE